MSSYMLSVDGAKQTGWALWDVSTPEKRTALVGPIDVGVIVPVATVKWEGAIDWTSLQIDELFNRFNDSGLESFVDIVVCEYPQFFQSFAGMTSAAHGDLVKLAIMYGRINQIAVYHSATFKGVEVNTWKGQMSKDAVIHRIKKRLGADACLRFKTHIWDAVGIGLWAKGHF